MYRTVNTPIASYCNPVASGLHLIFWVFEQAPFHINFKLIIINHYFIDIFLFLL